MYVLGRILMYNLGTSTRIGQSPQYQNLNLKGIKWQKQHHEIETFIHTRYQ